MKISEIYKNKKHPFSFEIFPPKGELSIESAVSILKELSKLSPDFISVTHSAGGGGTVESTVEISSIIKNRFKIESMAHLTCINSARDDIEASIKDITDSGVDNVLALRGDRKPGFVAGYYKYAVDLINEINKSGLCIGAACYPEGHIESNSLEEDIENLKHKQNAGAEFFVSQLFFDTDAFLKFIYKTHSSGLTKPVSAGIMPMLSKNQISRMIFMCGASLPVDIIKILHKYENSPLDIEKAGIEFANKQIDRVLSETDCGIHIYTMNRPEIAKELIKGRH